MSSHTYRPPGIRSDMEIDTSPSTGGGSNDQPWNFSFDNHFRGAFVVTNSSTDEVLPWNALNNTNPTRNYPIGLMSSSFDHQVGSSMTTASSQSAPVPSDGHLQKAPLSQAGGSGQGTIPLPLMMQQLSAKMELISQLAISVISNTNSVQTLSYWDNVFATNCPGFLKSFSINTDDNNHITDLIATGVGGSVSHQSTSSTDSRSTGYVAWHNNHSFISDQDFSSASRTPISSSNHDPTWPSPQVSRRTTKPSNHSHISQPVCQNSMFYGSSNVKVVDSNIAINNNMSPDAGLIILARAASQDAMHDSSERYPPPKCHPKTRASTIDFFVAWIKTQKPRVLIYWLHAPFGHGKSAVMQSIMDRLVNEGLQHLFGGGFFFGRGRKGRDKIVHLFATIAYQIALFIPGMREYINNAVVFDPNLPSKSIEIQLRSLIIDPLFKCADGSHFRHSPTVFIDGLDECDTMDSQVIALQLIATAVHDHHIPLRFLIASRPETHIRDCFDRNPLSAISKRKKLPHDDDEMTAYVRTKFDEIYDNRSRIMRMAGIHKPWPSPEDIDGLVERASGQYIFIDTVLRFVGAQRLNPVTQLEIVLNRLSDDSVFTNMDSVYRLILEGCPDIYRDTLDIVINYIISSYSYTQGYPSSVEIAQLEGISPAEICLVVESLAAVVEDRPNRLDPYHLSFLEFLQDESRSGIFFCDKDLADEEVLNSITTFLESAIAGDLLLQSFDLLSWCQCTFVIFSQIPPSELLELVRRGQSKTVLSIEAHRLWYTFINQMMHDVRNGTSLVPSDPYSNRDPQYEDRYGLEELTELYNCCLGIWKGIADTAFAVLDSGLINAVFSMDSRKNFTISDVAGVAGMDEEECYRTLSQHRVLFYYEGCELSMDTKIYFHDRFYYKLNEDGTYQRIRDIRKTFYNNLG